MLGETETETLLIFPSLCVSLDNAQSGNIAARNKAYDDLCASKADSRQLRAMLFRAPSGDQYKEQHAQTMNQCRGVQGMSKKCFGWDVGVGPLSWEVLDTLVVPLGATL